MTKFLFGSAIVLMAVMVLGQPGPEPDLSELLSADAAVAATVTKTYTHAGTNSFGDQLILTRVTLRHDMVIKGRPPLVLEVPGGTLNGITMQASETPTVHVGDHGVFLTKNGKLYGHHSMLVLDDVRCVSLRCTGGHIRGSAMTLSRIKEIASGGGA